LSELELSKSDGDRSAASILGVCLDGFDGDAWMSDAEGAHDDIQVGEVAGVNDPGDIPWRTTAWGAGGVDVGSVKTAQRASEGRKQPALALSYKTVTRREQKLVRMVMDMGQLEEVSQVRGGARLEWVSH